MSERQEWIETAAAIGARLVAEAIWHEERCTWLGDSMEYVDDDWRVVHRTCGVTLYDGTGGIALFLARLHRATGDPLVRATARGALRHSCHHALDLPSSGRLGLYSGVPGVALAALESGRALGDEEWTVRGNELLRTLSPESDDGEGLDVIGGAAGAIPLLLWQGDDRTRELALRLGERLLLRAERVNGSASWATMPTPDGRNLTGYSHGAAGIALALLELGAATRDERFLDLGRAGIEYERGLYDRTEGNWPDLRFPSGNGAGVPCSMAWCHGAPGIGLARLRTFELLHDTESRREAETALEATHRAVDRTVRSGVLDFSLCHGLAGMAELFLSAESTLSDGAWERVAHQVGGWGVERLKARLPWPCGIPNGGETPALLTGLAGIGHFYLRLADPETVPSVLILSGQAA
jgi:lantibiotic modifying enzyme